MATIFVSYSRKDVDPIRDLGRQLRNLGHETWRDLDNLPPASIWSEEIARAIEQRDVFLFAVSSNSLASPHCQEELRHALRFRKRVIPVVILEGVRPEDSEPPLSTIDWIFLVPPDQAQEGMKRLEEAIRTDLDHLRQHTRFLNRALEWERNPRDRSLLLRGALLREAEGWLAQSSGKGPPVAREHEQLVAASVEGRRRRRIWGAGLACLLALAAVAGAGRLYQASRSDLSRRLAEDSRLSSEPENAFLLAVAAHEAAPTSNAILAIFERLTDQPQLIAFLHGPTSDVEALAFHPRDPLMVAAGGDGALYLWDTLRSSSRGTVPTGEDSIAKLVFARDGRFLASGGWDGRIRFWSPGQAREISPSLDSEKGLVEALALHPDGRFLVAGYSSGARLWDRGERPPRWIDLPVSDRRINEAGFDEAGTSLAVVEGTEYLRVWDFSKGSLSRARELRPDAHITALAWQPGRVGRLVLGLTDGTLAWVDAGGDTLEIVYQVRSHAEKSVLHLAFDEDGTRLASAGADGMVHVWEELGEKPLLSLSHRERVFAVAFQPGSSRLAASGSDPAIRLWDTGQVQPLARLAMERNSEIQSVAISEDGGSAVAGTLDGELLRIDLAGQGAVEEIPVEAGGVIWDLATRGDRIVWGGEEGRLGVWDLKSGAGELLPTQSRDVSAVAIQPGGEVFAIGRDDGHVSLWRSKGRGLTYAETALSVEAMPGQSLSAVMDLAFSPDGRWLVAGDNEGRVLAWKTGSLRPLRSWQVPEKQVVDLDFSPEGRRLAISNGADGTITLLDPYRDEAPRSLDKAKCTRINSLMFQSEQWLLIGCNDGTLEVLDVSGEERLGTLQAGSGGLGGIDALALSPAGDFVVSGSADGRLLVWDFDVESWKRRVCRRADRELVGSIPGWIGPPPRSCAEILKDAPPEPPGLREDESGTDLSFPSSTLIAWRKEPLLAGRGSSQ